jgi:hypothetical protein
LDNNKTIAAEYERLAQQRQPFLDRARENAELTIPDIFPPEGHNGSADLPDPNQSTGAQGLNNLSAKLTYTLLPIAAPFFRYNVSEETLTHLLVKLAKENLEEGQKELETEQMKQIAEQVTAASAEMQQSLNKVVTSIIEEGENAAARVALGEGVKQLIVAGNVCLEIPEEGSVRYIRMTDYVLTRDGYGDLTRIIIKEMINPSLIEDEELRAKVLASIEQDDNEDDNETQVTVYREFTRTVEDWAYQLEAGGEVVEDGSYELNRLPLIPLRLFKVDGQDWGRAFISEYRGALSTHDTLELALKQGAVAKARIIPLVKPNSQTDLAQLNKAANLEFVFGNPDDITPLTLSQNNADMSVAYQHNAGLKQALSEIFLINSAFARSGDRVTAQEMRFRAEQLDDALGGIYSILALELQKRLIEALSWRMEMGNRMPDLPEDIVTPSIVAGLEALGQNHKLDQMRTFASVVGEIFGPQALAGASKVSEGITRIANIIGIDWEGISKSEEELAAEQQQLQQQEMINKLGPQALAQGGKLVEQQVAGQQEAAPAE